MEYLRKKLWVLLGVVATIFCLWLVVTGHKTISYSGLSLMLVGLMGILVILFFYNEQYK